MRLRFEKAVQAIKETSPMVRLQRLGDAAAAAGEDPEGCVQPELRELVESERKRLVVLTSGGRSFPAVAVSACAGVGPALRCSGAQADDSAHLTELGVSPLPMTKNAQGELRLYAGYRPAALTLYSTTNGSQPRVIALSRGHLFRLPASSNLLILITRQSDGGFLKFVWPLDFRD
jgi:hypothetical protein